MQYKYFSIFFFHYPSLQISIPWNSQMKENRLNILIHPHLTPFKDNTNNKYQTLLTQKFFSIFSTDSSWFLVNICNSVVLSNRSYPYTICFQIKATYFSLSIVNNFEGYLTQIYQQKCLSKFLHLTLVILACHVLLIVNIINKTADTAIFWINLAPIYFLVQIDKQQFKGVLFVEMDLTLEYHKINHMPIAIMYYNTKLEIYDRYKVRSFETTNWSKQFILFDECGPP